MDHLIESLEARLAIYREEDKRLKQMDIKDSILQGRIYELEENIDTIKKFNKLKS